MTDWVRIKHIIFCKDLIQAVRLKRTLIRTTTESYILYTIEVMLNNHWIDTIHLHNNKKLALKLLSDIENQLKEGKNEP